MALRIEHNGSGKLAWAVAFAFCQIWAVPQILYDTTSMPRVDVHCHFSGGNSMYDFNVVEMEKWGGSVLINLEGRRNFDFNHLSTHLDDRIIPFGRGGWWSASEMGTLKSQGFSGFKYWHGDKDYVSQCSDIKYFAEHSNQGMPMLIHVGIKPEDGGDHMGMIHDMEGVMQDYSSTTFIIAHGFWLMNRTKDLDTLARLFDDNPNLYVDLSAVTQYWAEHEVGGQTFGVEYDAIRNFVIEYKDRIVYGSDSQGGEGYYAWMKERQRYETDKPLTGGYDQSVYPGLNFPLDVLNHIWYWNAAQIVPRVKESLEGLGYVISDEPPEEPIVMVRPVSQSFLKRLGPVAELGSGLRYYVAEPSNVKISICSPSGKFVEVCPGQQKGAGFHTVRWSESPAGSLSSGVYFYSLQIGNKAFTGKVSQLK